MDETKGLSSNAPIFECDECGAKELKTVHLIGDKRYCACCYLRVMDYVPNVCPLCGKPLG